MCVLDDSKEGVGTITWMVSVESSLEHDSREGGGRVVPGATTERPRAKHDYRDIGGRVMPGAITEEARAECVRFYSGHSLLVPDAS